MFGPSFHMTNNYHHNDHQWKMRSNTPRGRWTQGLQERRIQIPHVNFRQNEASTSGNEDHWCETCDRGFRTIQLLENHKLQHQKCNIDGCQFIAHPKIITKHIQMQHSTGLYKKIAKLDDPQEIKKWREERKRKYPTKDNIEKKEAQVKQKIDRGEKMGLKPNESRKNQNKKTGVGAKRRHNFRNENQPKKCFQKHNSFSNTIKHATRIEIEKVTSVLEDHLIVKPFNGIQELVMDIDTEENSEQFNFAIVDDDYIPESSKTAENDKPTLCGALSSLIGNYGSSDDENEDANCDNYKITSARNRSTSQENIVNYKNYETVNVRINKDNKSDEESGPEESKIIKEIENNNGNKEEPYSKKKKCISSEDKKLKMNKPIRVHMKPKPKLPSTLLEKLLHREVQHERNVILQCVRYVIKNNFFDK